MNTTSDVITKGDLFRAIPFVSGLSTYVSGPTDCMTAGCPWKIGHNDNCRSKERPGPDTDDRMLASPCAAVRSSEKLL